MAGTSKHSVWIFVVLVGLAQLATTRAAVGQEGRRRLRTFGQLPGWALESWGMRRQIEPAWALTGGHVVDVRTGEVLKNATIVISGDLIRSIDQKPPPEDMEVVEIKGLYVVPGLFDLHAHVIPKSIFFPDAKGPEETLRILLDAGVTTIRALPFYSESAHQWSAKINAGHLIGPTIVPTSSIFEKEAQRTSCGFGDAETARAWVQKEALLGARWIKVYNSMDEASFKTIVKTARAHGMKVCGHTEDVPPHRASELGIGSVEHIISLPLSCRREGSKSEETTDLLARTSVRWADVDEAKLTKLMQTFRKNGTAWVPTLVVTEQMARIGSHDGKETTDEGARRGVEAAVARGAKLAVQFHRDGGLVGLGTDFPVDGVKPGESVHRELELLVEKGGAKPLEALQIATTASAKILGFESLLGTLSPGKIANMVVVRENPLEDISRMRDVALVVHDGRARDLR